MSSKKFVYLLMTVAIVCGFIMGGTAHGQSTSSITIKGTVMEADGTPAPGYAISGETIPGNAAFNFVGNPSRTDGSYDIVAFSFAGAKLNVGDMVKITATDAQGNAVSVTHTLTADDITSGIVNLDIVLSGVTVTVNPIEVPADGKTTSTITVTVQEGGSVLAGDTVTITADKGTVGAVTDAGNGTYTATYTPPSLVLVIPDVAQINVSSSMTGNTARAAIALLPVPTTVSVSVDPSSFIADTPSDGAVTVTVDRAGPVTGETVTLALSPAVGSVGAVTDNGDGTYGATYTSGGTAGNVTLTATATSAAVSGSATITINAGPPAAIALSAAPMTVTSLGSSTVTAMVTDSAGNGVGGLTLTATTTSGGTVGEFAATAFGTYTVTYTAPMVAMGDEGPETITVSTDGVSADITLDLTSEPPIPVNIITIEGTVYKEDGEIPADGAAVTVTIGSNSPEMRTTDADGSYEVTLVVPLNPVATTGDIVSVAVADANVAGLSVNGMAHGGSSFPLVNDILEQVEAGMSVMVDVTTDIVIPPRSVNVLEVMGMVYKEDGSTSGGGGLDVAVTVGSSTQTVQTDPTGTYSASFVELLMPVATTGDMLSVAVSDGSSERGRGESALSNLDLGLTGSATVTRDITTDIGLTSNVLAVLGTVYLKNGDTEHVPAANYLREGDLTITVANTTRNLSMSATVDNNGEYSITFFDAISTVAETGDVLSITVQNDAGETVASVPHTLTIEDVQTARVDTDIMSDAPAEVRVLAIEGDVINTDGSPAEPGLQVTIKLDMHGMVVEAMTTTDAAGEYTYNFVDLTQPVAATGDVLLVEAVRESDQFRGERRIELSSQQLQNQPLVVLPPIQLIPPTLRLGGLSINTSHADDYYGYLSLEAIKKNPELLQLIPSGILHLDLLQNLLATLPPAFSPTADPTADITERYDIDQENFGNGITPRPAWHVLAESSPPDPGRWLNGNQLNLYVVTGPISIVQSVTFTLTGPHSGMMEAMLVPADGTYMHTFQLEEERAILFLPSWPELNANMPIFSGVTLMIDGHVPVPMTSKLVGDEVVWEAPAMLTANSTVYYYYQVELAEPYQLEDTTVVTSWPMPDPRNLQVENRGIVETLLAPDVPELKEIVTTTDLKLRSVFDVPVIAEHESLWVATFDFPAGADGPYSVDTVVQYKDGLVRNIPNQMFTLDRTPPTADIMVGIGENAGVYQRDDGSYVAAALTDAGTLTLTAMPMGAPLESDAYLYQMIQLSAEGNPGVHVWNSAMAELPLTYMMPHQIQIPIGDVGNYGVRAVGVDSILNISSNTMPRRLNIVPPDLDSAIVTFVHADYNGDGTTDGPFEMEQSADGATIFSDRSNVNLTVEMIEQTDHPLKSIAIDFQINGAGNWKPIAMLTGDDLAGAKAGLQVNWNRIDDFADLLDIRGQAAVRVTVTNALDVEDQKTVTVELVPPALQLGGLSINTGYEAGLNALQGLRGLDVTALAVDLLGTDPSSLISPSPLPLALALLGTLDYIQSALPAGFETTDEQIHRENFGNAITPKPIWYPIASADQRDAGRWINGNQLHLYTFAGPTAESLTFSITGAQTAMAAASKVETGGSFMYNFQLEEELIAIFAGSMPAFAAVTLMIDGQPPIDMAGNAGVWSAEAALTPGSTVSYYYRVELAQPYQDMFINKPIQVFPIPDPRNLQIEENYAIQAIMALLNEGIDALDTFDPSLRSVFTVPAVDDDSQSLWVGKLNLPADGMYQLEVAVQYSGGSADALTGKMFAVDTTAPTADTMVHLDTPGENIGMYLRDEDGTYVATALPNPGGANLNVSATPIDDSDLETYLYQLARLDAAGNPGTWNPMLTVDLQAVDIMKLLSNPASAVPLTSRPPHHVQMLVRDGAGNDLDYGTYGLRVVGIDNILNADSSRGPGVVLDLVPPDPDIAEVSYVAADFDGNGVIEGLETQSTAGDVAVFSDSLVTLTVDVVERTVHPLASIAIEVEMPGLGSQPVAMFSGDQLAATMLGDQFMVTLPVPDVPGLPDGGAQVILRTVTTNALNIVSTREVSVAYQRRTPPEVSAIHTYVTDRHPDSGAVQGTITVSAFTQAMTAPDAAAVQLEIRRTADADWMPLGIVQIADTTVTSHVQIAIIGDLVNAILSGAPSAPIPPLYREWPLAVDSATLEDTIMDDSPAASDASLDDNPYVLRAIAVDTAGTGYPSADGVTDSFSLDNYSPTEITQVANEVEMVAAREDGSYYVSGLIAEGVPDPMLTLTSRTGAHPNAFMGGIALAVNDASGTAVEIAETAFTGSGDHTYTAAFNLASIPNGMYTFMAVGHTADGAGEERIVAMAITVEVDNFTPPDDFADPTVDILSVTNTRGQANSPSDTDAQYPIGLPAIGDEVCVTLIVPNVSAGDVDVLIGDDLMSAAMRAALTVMDPDANNNIGICIDTSGLDEDMYSLVGTVSKPNGSVQFGLPSIRVDRTAPVIEIVSPLEGHQVSTVPTVQVAYTDDTGFDPEKTNPMPVEITLTRLASDKTVDTNTSMIRTIAAAGEVLTQTGNIVYSHDDQLAGGAYRIDATVTDALGNTSTAEPVEFTTEGVQPSVAIITPSAGQVVDPDQALIISAAFTGIGEITVEQLLINGGTYTPQSVKDNLLTHTIQPPFGVLFKRGSGNRISIKIVDEEGNTAEATTNFAVAKDTTPPVVATYSPLGIIRTDRPIAAATVTDESGINTRSLTIIIAGVPGNQGSGRRSSPTSTTITFTPSISVTPGPYTARVTVEDVHGNRTEAEWQFTVELDVTPPSITTSSPHGVIRSDKPIISVSASDDMSGVDTIEIGVKGEGNQTVEGVTSVRSDKTSATFTPTVSLTSGTYTVNVKLADMRGNKASGQWQFTVELDTVAPIVFDSRPSQEHTENRRPAISATYTDTMSGVDVGSVKLTLDGSPVEPDTLSDTQVAFTPKIDLPFGPHTVKLEVSDMAPAANTAVQEWTFYVERVGIANVRNYPNPFEDDTTIAFRVSRQASITIRIYDFTGRLVAQPVANARYEAGEVKIDWHGQTAAGDHLARGVYFCHILMEDNNFESQSAILKMAIISE